MISQRIKELRARNNISQKELSGQLFVSPQAISKWERNEATPNPEAIAKMAEIFNVSADYLLGRTDQMEGGSMNRLKELRLAHGYKSQKDLADVLLVNQTAVSQWERGVTMPSSQMMLKLSNMFGVSTDYLLGRTDQVQDAYSKYIARSVKSQIAKEKAPAPEDEHQIGFDDFAYAMHNETKDLPPEKKEMLLQMARYMNEAEKKEGRQ